MSLQVKLVYTVILAYDEKLNANINLLHNFFIKRGNNTTQTT